MDVERIHKAVRDILIAVGEDPDREGLRETPRRVGEMYAELFSGLGTDPAEELSSRFTATYDEMVVLKDIPFNSVCEHHLMPFEGKAGVAYLPDGKVVGVSKLARVVESYARRPQLQERLTSQVADVLMDALAPKGVAVVVQDFRDEVEASGVDFHVVVIPDRFQINVEERAEIFARLDMRDEDFDWDKPQRAFRSFFENEGISYLDLLPAFREASLREPIYATDNTHWNIAGNAFAAREIGAWLTPLLPQPAP